MEKKIIQRIKDNWDWFETTKFLSMGYGILFTTGFVILYIMIENWLDYNTSQRIGLIIIFVGSQLLGTLMAKMVNLIRRDNKE